MVDPMTKFADMDQEAREKQPKLYDFVDRKLHDYFIQKPYKRWVFTPPTFSQPLWRKKHAKCWENLLLNQIWPEEDWNCEDLHTITVLLITGQQEPCYANGKLIVIEGVLF